MVHTETIDLSPRNVVFPSDRVGMVIAQPHLSLTREEPFRCTNEAKPELLTVLRNALAVARQARHGAPKTHFTIFPEYSIPGREGVTLVDDALRAVDWPTGTIVIGGTDALSKPEFVAIASANGSHIDASHNSFDRVAENEWINCGITWVKGADGSVERWLQPKLFPAWLEQDVPYQGMFRGNSVFTFRGPFENDTQYHFCSLVCFYWVATLQNERPWHWVLEGLRQQVAPGELSLSWFFVIQCNPKPSHDNFLTQVAGFFDQNVIPNVRRDRACLVFANSAGKPRPSRIDEYGGTSLVFSRQALFTDPECRPTFSNGGKRFRSSTLLTAYHDVFFRERGACIHSFLQLNPGSLKAGADGKACAVENASVFPANGAMDPRTPSAPVPACVKWLNDELDDLASLSSAYPAVSLASQADTVHQQNIAALRLIPARSVVNTIKLAAQESTDNHADEWGQTEAEALEHLVHTLDIVALGFSAPTVGADPAHATVVMSDQVVDVLAIRGRSHEECVEHSKQFQPRPARQVLLVSRDWDNNPWHRRFGSYLRTEVPELGQERNITDPESGSLHIGYRLLLDLFQQSTTAGAVTEGINAELAR